MSRTKRILLTLLGLVLARRSRLARTHAGKRILPTAPKELGAELAVIALLATAALLALGFVVVYATSRIPHGTQFLGLTIGLAFIAIAAALLLVSRQLVVTEELVDNYPPVEHNQAQGEIAQLVHESGQRFTRRRLVVASGSAAGLCLGTALLAPLASLGPVFDLDSFVATPWHRGRRLVGQDGRPITVDQIDQGDFYSAYPENADREQLGAPLIVVRLPPSQLQLPPTRIDWAPHGILAYSKICTHAGCAISLYRAPNFAASEPKPALVCPCHYSTFDPATGGTVTFGPAGRPLPQLPIEVGPNNELRAAGVFSGPIGPSWWGVRSRQSK